MSKGYNCEDLLKLIETKRREMIMIANKTGMTSPQTIQTSIELDGLLNLHRRFTEKAVIMNKAN
ncbi:aspartyl-phosphate phosphatase Spo0E family protein [Cytobacillus spongiae]|jgi:hypothetical protein|uniref:aspartyl-phosphate phosphatase Spo0E family protein n=1 Tax=Cytobacillus spongiae TaxID=2901381 RepID=UPI001F2F8FD3|nr:aspartyl-phosphate phosphatase Spo0E family protein [Cytobacillus spongiae]UII57196.1 aspartyl-phosphate phosphatase Spo0E family protein [Cytobacillus spongiae]